MSASRVCAVTAFTALVWGACGSEPRHTEAPRLVLLYAPCTVAREFLAPYAPNIPFTPRLADFARESVVFRRHQTEAPSSGIAYASIFTGAQADHHGVYRHPTKLSDALYLIFEAYRDRGYETFFWDGHPMAGAGQNYAQGVDPDHHFGRPLQANDPRFAAILSRLRKDESYRAFVVTNFTTTHGPYRLNGFGSFRRDHPTRTAGLSRSEIRSYAKLYRANHLPLAWNTDATLARLGLDEASVPKFSAVVKLLYESRVSQLDRMFGEVVEAIRAGKLQGDSLIAFTADHGEVLRRENAAFQWSHSMQLASEVLAVPLIIRHPSLSAGAYESVSRSIDLYPTLLGLSGLPPVEGSGVAGVDLSPALLGREPAPALPAFSHTTVLVRGVFLRLQRPGAESDWGAVATLYPSEDPEHMWVALRRGDRLYKTRTPVALLCADRRHSLWRGLN